jgi:hypothetical protein
VPAGVPQYFVELCGGQDSEKIAGTGTLVAANVRTGVILGSVAAPAGFDGLYAAANDRAFLVDASQGTGQGPRTTWWMLRLAPGTAHPVRFTQMPLKLVRQPLSLSVSPDGTQVVTAGGATIPGSPGLTAVVLYSVATGAVLHSWTSSDTIDSIGWTGTGQALVYQANGTEFLVHDIATPGRDLAAGSTPLVTIGSPGNPVSGNPAECTTASNWKTSADGTTFICAAMTETLAGPGGQPTTSCSGKPPVRLAFLRLAAGSREPGSAPAGTDYTTTDPCGSYLDATALWWASPDGTAVIGQLSYPGHNEMGVFYGGRYVPLPSLGTTAALEPWMIAF